MWWVLQEFKWILRWFEEVKMKNKNWWINYINGSSEGRRTEIVINQRDIMIDENVPRPERTDRSHFLIVWSDAHDPSKVLLSPVWFFHFQESQWSIVSEFTIYDEN